MALLLRIARQAELTEGGKIVKEAYGRKILLARVNNKVYATDAHCYHMGGALWEGDIEDVGGHACIVCPVHRYKIDMSSGQKVDTMLDGCVSCSSDQQQRTYAAYQDDDHICIDIPELHIQQALPSDQYNQVPAAPQQAQFQQAGPSSKPGRGSYGLFGSSSGSRLGLAAGQQAMQPEPLAPYAGFQQRGMVPSTPAKDAMEDEPALQLSQEARIQLSQPSPPVNQQQRQQQPSQYGQGHIPFAQSRVDTARIARRKAATAAILANKYTPPSASPLQQAAPRGLLGSGIAPSLQQQQHQAATTSGGLARTASNGGQQSLLSFGFTVQQRSPAVAAGPSAMDIEL